MLRIPHETMHSDSLALFLVQSLPPDLFQISRLIQRRQSAEVAAVAPSDEFDQYAMEQLCSFPLFRSSSHFTKAVNQKHGL
jgi:hypothetical protein